MRTWTLFFAVFLTMSLKSYAQEESNSPKTSPEVEVITEQFPDAKPTDNKRNQIEIRLSNGQVFEIPARPDAEEMKAALGLKLPDKVKEKILANGGSIVEENPLQAFESLSPDRQEKFLEVRQTFLASAARILNRVKFAAGAGSLVGNSFSFLKIKVQKLRGREVPAAVDGPTNFADRSNRAVKALLQSIDYKLWAQAPLVIDSNEIGVSLSAGIIAETGVGRRGFGGIQELGFSIAFNKTSRAFVFEIFHNGEGFDSTRAAVSVLGVMAKGGLVISRRAGVETAKGSSFYPPAVPGYSMASPDYFAAGFSSGLGLPPPPLADFLTYTNKFERNSLIRITVSPIVKGFVRVQIGDIRGSVRLVVMPVVDLVRTISEKVIRYAGRNSCRRVFQ